MAYSNFRLQLALYIVAIIACTGTITLLAMNGADLLWLLPLFVALLLFVSSIARLASHPLKVVKMFLLAIRSNDHMIRMPAVKDRMLQDMYDNMNKILSHYHDNELSIETKKLYFERILRIMTHEIRNTVTPIVTLSDYYIDNADSMTQEDIKEGITIINKQSKSIKQFLDSYHTLTHLPPPVPVKISIPELFNEMYRLFKKESENVKLTIHYPNMHITADNSEIRIVLSNLLRNAIESAAAYKDGNVELRATICDNSPQITITDNGSGIPQNRIEDIFFPFYSTKEHGNGIGLCISRHIMRLHGGDLIAESYPESRHTTFTMKFDTIRQ